MPCPISPARMTTILALLMVQLSSSDYRAIDKCGMRLSGGIAAVGIKDMAGIEIRRFGGEEKQRAREIGRLAKAALGYAGNEALADCGGVFIVLIHPGGQR